MANGTTDLTSDTFDDTINTALTPVVVDLWADWCGPCKKVAPILDELAVELDGQIQIAKLNIDQHPDIAPRFGVMSIPTLLVFDGGEVRKTIVGAKSKAALLEEFDEFLGSH